MPVAVFQAGDDGRGYKDINIGSTKYNIPGAELGSEIERGGMAYEGKCSCAVIAARAVQATALCRTQGESVLVDKGYVVMVSHAASGTGTRFWRFSLACGLVVVYIAASEVKRL